MNEFRWIGNQKSYVDEIHVKSLKNEMVIGLFGGNSSEGQYKNEDGCLVWYSPGEWEFAVIMDGHDTAESVELVLEVIGNNKEFIHETFKKQIHESFHSLQDFIVGTFKSDSFRKKAKKVQGETACLFVLRKENFLWWFSIGDCILHIFHPELSSLGEFQQNHRSFYEWVGNNSNFNKPVPSYSSGIKELRTGENHIFLTTDGLTECPNTHYVNPRVIMDEFGEGSVEEGVHKLINQIKCNGVKDSTTIITWKVMNKREATVPSDIK
ncbi:protein phosphatase 2C domain-containing protein [Bacillus sp. Marseille-Q1617]|uniref:protein phosphatase 2C domain-containing protein n=1 Tax=Bacillus sp. Marseille-Q1617 TaxID=2736887 RepID=UPI00158CABBD|nr:protein phosphatase 2C domain-containing protein [Bacillus sp. Marseille-Q1617]